MVLRIEGKKEKRVKYVDVAYTTSVDFNILDEVNLPIIEITIVYPTMDEPDKFTISFETFEEAKEMYDKILQRYDEAMQLSLTEQYVRFDLRVD